MKRSPLIILFVTIFLDLLGFGLIIPLIPIYIQHYGGKPWTGGALLACFSLMQFIFSPIWGRTSDRVGRRPMILLSLIGSAISFMAFGAAPNLAVLFIARISAGILSSASLPTAQAYIADVTPPDKRAGGMAMIGAAFGLGFALGPAISGPLSQHPVFGIAPLAMPAFFAAFMCACNFLFAVFKLPETHLDRSEHKGGRGVKDIISDISTALENPAVKSQITVFAFATFAFTAVESSFSWLTLIRFRKLIQANAQAAWASYSSLPFANVPAEVKKLIPSGVVWSIYGKLPLLAADPKIRLLLEDKAATAISTRIFMNIGLTILVVQMAVMRGAAAKVGERKLILAGSIILTFTLIGIALAHSLQIIEILSIFVALGNGILNPSLSSLISQAATKTNRGTISGAQQGIGSLARIIAPPINNTLVGWHTSLPFLGSAVLMGIAAFLASMLKIPVSQDPPSDTPAPVH